MFVKRLSDGRELNYHGERPWYLASTVKVPVAIIVMQKVEDGTLSLDEEITLKATDYVDGSGDTNWLEPGTKIKLSQLLEKMLTQSDSTATDLLIKRVGVAELNRRLRTLVPQGFQPISTILQVRYEAYSELHPRAKRLSNMDFFELKKLPDSEARLKYLIDKMGVQRKDLRARTIEEAFERYYKKRMNSSTLSAFADLLEKLARGKILSASSRDLVLSHMEKITTGEKRLKAGMPVGSRFAQKTGTQVRRICNMGIVRASEAASDDIIVAACLEKFSDPEKANETLKKVGETLSMKLVL